MNFFKQQERAKRKTVQLVLLYLLAVVVSLLLTYLVGLWGAIVWRYIYNSTRAHYDIAGTFVAVPNPGLWDPPVFGMVLSAGLVLMMGSTLRRLHFVHAGGDVLSATLGGTLVDFRTKDPGQRRLLNIVEEMAIASGVDMPLVHVLKREVGINAFSAGLSTNVTVVAVTQGALDVLTRDELQAIVAHEYCHIL
jgi:Zn-dependent protease with chaperone function